MKKIFSAIALGLVALTMSAQSQTSAQPEVQNTIQMSVYFDEDQEDIPTNSRNILESKIKAILGRNMMGATNDFTQFVVNCSANKVYNEILPGAPTKYRQEIEINFYVLDVMAKKMFTSETISVHAVANSENKAYTECFRQVNVANKQLNEFFKTTSAKIISYYNSQYKNIITVAQSLAKVKKYDEALFRLSMVPEACEGYAEVIDAASAVYQKYIDHEAYENLAKATAIWNASQDTYGAIEAATYLAQINPDASCYEQAVALQNEIKKGVKDNIEYERAMENKKLDYAHQETQSQTEAWRAVGIAYGNNQKAHTYHDAYLVR